MHQPISSATSAKPVGPYSPALQAGPWLFISGQVPVDPVTGEMVQGDIERQTHRVLENVRALLSAAGFTFQDVVRTTVFLADMNDFAAMNDAYSTFFREPYPARATVQVARLPRDARVEIDAIAFRAD